jgi:hypothetical protein
MIAKVRCGTCGAVGRLDVGDAVTTVEEAQAKVDASHIQMCPFGHHTELHDLHFEVLEIEAGAAPSLDEWKAQMAGRGYDVWTTEELRRTEIEITGFAFGFPMATVRGRDFWLNFGTAPDGDRYYYAPRGSYAEAIGQAEPQAVPAEP